MTTDKTKRFFRVSAEDFKKIPGSPIAYWLKPSVSSMLNEAVVGNYFISGGRFKTCDDEKYLRFFWEISVASKKWHPYCKGGDGRKYFGNELRVVLWTDDSQDFFTRNGGVGNQRFWGIKGLTWATISTSVISFRLKSESYFNSSSAPTIFAMRLSNLFGVLGYLNIVPAKYLLNIFNPTASLVVADILKLPLQESWLTSEVRDNSEKNYISSKSDWDSYETSWDFQENPLIQEAKATAKPSKAGEGLLSSHAENGEYLEASRPLADIYVSLRLKWRQQAEEMRRLETENNRIFIDAYGLRDELSPEVPWNEITLICNPWYRYGKTPENTDLLGNSFYLNHSTAQIKPTSKQEEDFPAGDFPFAHETEQRLLEDTIKEFISYAVGCMMGRYSPEKPGLILANQGDGFVRYHEIMSGQDSDEMMLISNATKAELRSAAGETLADDEAYRKKRQNRHPMLSSYQIRDCISSRYHVICDRDGVIPILDDEWFVDDIVAQFKDFLKFTFGEEAFSRNLDFIEKAIGKDIRKYFMKDFYKEHVQRYKKRPIYWLFSSPKGSFNALIYLHRYRPDTVSIVLNDYLREFMTKLRVQRSHLIDDNNRADLSASEKSANLKRIDKYAAMLAELEDYERDILFPLAQKQLAIDLDDGVKVNYLKFGAALKEIPGLKAREE